MLSAIVLTRDKKDLHPQTLKALSFTDELIVQVCDKIKDFATIRNQALNKAAGEWVLFIDSDEVVSQKLAKEIQEKIKDTDGKIQGFLLSRQDCFLGRWLKFGETANVQLLRLAKKNAGKWQGKVHETWEITGPVGKLKNPLLHYPHQTISRFITKINHYTDIRATEVIHLDSWQVVVFPLAKFLQNYILRLGFLDGFPGFIMAYLMSLHSLIVRVKLYDLSQASPATGQ